MPTYVYECRTCEKTFEVQQRMADNALTDCDCGAKGSLRRLIQPVGVIFNGAGFHINDYKAATAPVEKAAEIPAEACTGVPAACPACSTAPAVPATTPETSA